MVIFCWVRVDISLYFVPIHLENYVFSFLCFAFSCFYIFLFLVFIFLFYVLNSTSFLIMSDVTIFVNFVLTLSQMSWSFYKIVFDWFKISRSRIPYLLVLLFFCEHVLTKTFFYSTILRRSMRTSFFAWPFFFPDLLSSVKQLAKFLCGCAARQPSQVDLTWLHENCFTYYLSTVTLIKLLLMYAVQQEFDVFQEFNYISI